MSPGEGPPGARDSPAITGCTAAGASVGPPRVDLGEFGVEASVSFTAGSDSITVANAGEFGHTLVVADESGRVVDASRLVAPGEEITFDVELTPGTYDFTCRIVVQTGDGRLVDHYAEGMRTTVVVGGNG